MDKVHKTHFTMLEMPWKKEEGMDKYKLFFYKLAEYTNALADDCDSQSLYLHIHNVLDPWAESRKVFNQLPPEIRDTLNRLREDDDAPSK